MRLIWKSFHRVLWIALAVPILLLPMLADGFAQLCTTYESGNLRRLVTGGLFGYGLTVLLLASLGWAYRWGFGVGLTLLGK